MNNSHLLYLKEKGITWFNPSYGLNMFWDVYQKLKTKLNKPHDYVWSHRDLKRSKEIYAISIIAKVIEKQENKRKWWILKPKSDPPDGVIGTLIESDKGVRMNVREVEVVEHISGDILDTIRAKLLGKQYESNTILVCYISQGGVFDFEKLSEIICQEQTSLDHIFLVFPGMRVAEIPLNASQDELMKALIKVSSVQLKPVFSFCSVDPISDCKEWREGREGSFFIFDGLGKGGATAITLKDPPKLFT